MEHWSVEALQASKIMENLDPNHLHSDISGDGQLNQVLYKLALRPVGVVGRGMKGVKINRGSSDKRQ
jgi:hypothetical protein